MQHFHLPPHEIKFSAASEPETIQLMRVGTFYDERYGKVEITPLILTEMEKNFNNNVRKIDIALDFSHNSDGPAAGWIKRVKLSQDGQELWGEIDWTNAGKENLLGKEFRYVSPDFTFAYKDNETLEEHGAVLLGAGLTNRPVIKNMAPAITLHEFDETKYQEGDMMTPEEMKAALEKCVAEIAELKAKVAEPAAKPELEEGD